MDILRFITAGSVDDGKSTLIGRLLYDSKSILQDQLEAIESQSRSKADGELDLALLTDGLRAEREQGITIDVAYKYFSTPRRKFIIADAPGHIQYTRNMVTGASNSDLAIILVDARNGIIEQTRRHSIIASFLALPHVVVAVNKMDLVSFSEERFNEIVTEYRVIAETLGLKDVHYIPISALGGDNIVERSPNLAWYKGAPLLEFLENVEVQNDTDLTHPRFQVQYVIRPQTEDLHDYRGYAGMISSGSYRKGDAVTVLPSGIQSRIKAIEVAGTDAVPHEVEEAHAPHNIILHLEDDVDVSRGDTIVSSNNTPSVTNTPFSEDSPTVQQEIETLLCWMDAKPLTVGSKYLLQHKSRTVRAVVRSIDYKLDVNTLERTENVASLGLNDIAKVSLKTASPLVFDRYADLRSSGGAILVDETSYGTVGACMLQ
ncbi:MAG: sulfate adenylyltransferase [Ignavibacteria bacterium]|nr:sulfate adenylyltransferase [Ignavibacteria bacterium]